jgi:hypothetical protein
VEGAVCSALLAELPRILTDPPWRRARDEDKRPPAQSGIRPPAPSGAEEKPTLVWAEGERARFIGPPGRKLSDEAEERLYERLLDELDRERIVPCADLARLGDEHLLELAGELRAAHVDVKGLQHLVGRLGEDFVAEAVEIVRVALPERGLFEAMAPVRAPVLARLAANLFLHRELPDAYALERPFAPNAADAWLVRFADIAAPALAASDEEAARVALAWIAARGRADVIPASHADFVAPFAALAKLDRPWLSLLAAREKDTQVLSMLAAGEPEGVLFAARALGGNGRTAATAWLEKNRDVAKPILEESATDDARVGLALLGGDVTAGDPALDEVPAAVPELPAFFDPASLPKPKLRDGTSLDDAAVRTLGEMLRFTSMWRPYAGLVQVRGACDGASLDELGLAILARWSDAGDPPTDLWALESAAKIGGDGCAREVARRVRAWSKGAEPPRHAWDEESHRVVLLNEGDRRWAYARTGCQVLAANGSDLALTLLDDIARTGSSAWLRKEARRALDAAAEVRGEDARGKGGKKLPAAEMADDIVPDLGLDANGSTTLDLGARRFCVTFGEMLEPRLIELSAEGEAMKGTPLKTFPRTRKDDDVEKAAAAKRRFQSLAKDTKMLARQQVAELEAAMCMQRVWTLAAFRERFVVHPLLRHLGRRLLWACEDLSKTFRIAEDLSFADEHDESFVPDQTVRIVLVHPILLIPELRKTWSDRFGDYELLQPLPQLGRETFSASPEDEGQHQLARAEGMTTSRGRLFQLSRRGWSAQAEGGVIEEYFRVLPGGAHARIGISPGMLLGAAPEEDVLYKVTTVASTYALDRLPPIAFSELVRDVDYLGRG